MASWLIRLSPLPFIGIPRPSPPRTTQPPAKLFQKPKAGTRVVVFPASGWVPVGVTTAISAVSEKSFVSCSKKRGVNEMSPNPEWLFVVVAVGLFGFDDRQAADGIVADDEGDVDDQLQATAQRRQERVGAEVGIALRGAVERLGEREEPQPVQVAVHGVDPALPGAPPEPLGDGTQASFQPSLKNVESGSGRQVFGSGLPKIDSEIVSKGPSTTRGAAGAPP